MHRAFAIALIVVACTNAYSLRPSDEPETQSCSYSELYRKDGWSIPEINGARKKQRSPVLKKPEVFMTELEPKMHRSTLQRFSCSRDHPGRIEIENLEVGIIGLTSFDVGGRIFAYNVVYGMDGIAVEWSVRFYDLDGSGLFTLRRSERNRFVPELIPDWVKDGAHHR